MQVITAQRSAAVSSEAIFNSCLESSMLSEDFKQSLKFM